MAERNQDRYVKNDTVFICDGIGYCTLPTGAPCCIGPVDENGNPLEVAKTVVRSIESAKKAVTPPPPDTFIKGNDVTVQKTDDVTEKIRKLAGQGKSSREIERDLAAIGIFMSYRTVARRLQGVLPL